MLISHHLTLNSDSQHDAVVLLHGLFATRRSMATAKACLEERGYLVINWGYSTLLKSIDHHARSLVSTLEALQANDQVRTINFLTHSMGGILARYALHVKNSPKTHRIVMLAPPNTGSPLTRISLGPFARFFPAISQLSEAPDSLPNRLSIPNHIEVGIIAASSDFIVRVANTILPNQRDHCVIPTTHFALPHHTDALHKSLNFLATGRFHNEAELAAA